MHFIVNRTAGIGRGGINFDIVREYLDKKKIGYTYAETTYRGEEAILAKEALSAGKKSIIAVGGDGTIRGVAGALINTDVNFGILPFGTGNDMVKALKIPTEPIAAIENIVKGFVRKMDVGKVNGIPFLNVAGIGFDVDVVVETERYKTKYKGMLPYFLGVLSSILHRKKIPMKIEYDGETIKDNILLIDIANGSHFGGGMKVAPNASPYDNLFDVVIIKYVNFFRFLVLLPAFIKGTHIRFKKFVKVIRARHIKISVANNDEYPIQMDGEIDHVTPAEFELVAGGLNVFVPEDEDATQGL